VTWAQQRFSGSVDLEDLKNKQRNEIHEALCELSLGNQQQGKAKREEGLSKLDELLREIPEDLPLRGQVDAQALRDFLKWLEDDLGYELDEDVAERLDADQMRQRVLSAVDEKFHPEMRRLERAVLLEIVDTAWKDHLLVMDHLRSSVGLKGYAQLDPKVEYKREGMRLFDHMWQSVDDRTTELIFRMEQLSEDFVGSTWVETSAEHQALDPSASMAPEEEPQTGGMADDQSLKPIRNIGEKTGRNDPCPCGSGKKYKQCCMRRNRPA
jgi:preprotein translocase subunit SecA